MAQPVDFPQANMVFKAPANMPDCADLRVCNTGDGYFISKWKLNEEEWKKIAAEGEIYLVVFGEGHPPIGISAYPFGVEDAVADANKWDPEAPVDGLGGLQSES